MLRKIKQNYHLITFIAIITLICLGVIFRVDQFMLFNPDGIRLANQINDFATRSRAIIIQALPFVVLGTTISVFVSLYIKEDFILKYLPKNAFISNIMVSFLGVLMPVCECGNVPVARRLVMSGFSVSQAFVFLLAAPIINPVTIVATWEAFQDPMIVIVRIVSAFLIANLVGFIISRNKDTESLLTKKFYDEVCDHQDHDHEHHKSKLKEGIEIFQKEFIVVMPMLILGSIIAAASQTFIPNSLIIGIGQSIVLSILAMILFSFVISICSSVDAFLAVGFIDRFTTGSILSFLVFGPMIDIKILTMLSSSFKPKLLIMVTTIVTLGSILVGLIVNYLL